MKQEPQFEQIREEIEAKQRAILWPDALRAGRSVDEFFWKGDSRAKPIQRAGLVIFAVMFWFMGIYMVAACLAEADDEWIARFFGCLIGSVLVLVSIRLFRNAFLRQKAPHKQ